MSVRPAPLVLAAPSGTGKTTLARKLVEESDRYRFSISATTRPAREGERDGIDYHFVDEARFREMISAGEFVEWAEVHGRLYGTPSAELDAAAERGEHVILDIDVQGARQIREVVPDVKLIFVLPPSLEVLLDRLRSRGTETEEDVERRLRSALEELRVGDAFDHVVVNDEVDRCLSEIREIVEEGREPRRHIGEDRIAELRAGIARIVEGD